MTERDVGAGIRIRRATADDVPGMVALLADDPLGAARETPGDLAPYRAAFEAVDADPRQLLVVADRGGGLGTQLVRWAIDEARRRGCALVQLTSDASRGDAHRFYERLGFVPSHVGFKLALPTS